MIERGTLVRCYEWMEYGGSWIDSWVGIVDGNDSEVTENTDDINYYICPAMYADKENWSDYYVMLRREQFETLGLVVRCA